MSDKAPLASEASHWYAQDGTPVYEVPRATGEGRRPTTLADARKLDLVPSVTLILRCAAQPGLDAWKLRQMFEVAYTTPRMDGESDDEFYGRVVIESKEKARLAAEKGTELHAAIEGYIAHTISLPALQKWEKHLDIIETTLGQYGIDIFKGRPEHSFASSLGFGGKIDTHSDEWIIDFKSKAKVKDVKQLAWPEHCWQLAAYGMGLQNYADMRGIGIDKRLVNVFCGIEDVEIIIHEWNPEDASRGWQCFEHLLAFWKLKNCFGDKL